MTDRRPIEISPVSVDRMRTWQRTARRFGHYYVSSPRLTMALLASFVVMHGVTGLLDWRAGRASPWFAVFGARSTETLVALGGRSHALIAEGEVWRLLTCGWLHGDLSHLFFNSLAFWGLGRLCEAVFGPARMLWLFVVCVLGGSLLGQTGDGALSVGASGGVFGLMGALVGFGMRRRRTMAPALREVFTRQMWPWILLNLVIGAVIPFIDQRAHVGGLVTGAVWGLLLGDRVTDVGQASGSTGSRVLGGLAAALIVGAYLGLVLG